MESLLGALVAFGSVIMIQPGAGALVFWAADRRVAAGDGCAHRTEWGIQVLTLMVDQLRGFASAGRILRSTRSNPASSSSSPNSSRRSRSSCAILIRGCAMPSSLLPASASVACRSETSWLPEKRYRLQKRGRSGRLDGAVDAVRPGRFAGADLARGYTPLRSTVCQPGSIQKPLDQLHKGDRGNQQ